MGQILESYTAADKKNKTSFDEILFQLETLVNNNKVRASNLEDIAEKLKPNHVLHEKNVSSNDNLQRKEPTDIVGKINDRIDELMAVGIRLDDVINHLNSVI